MPLPRRQRRSPYRRPRFPNATWMVLVDDAGAEDGPYRVAHFAPSEIEPGVWVCQTEAGHARFLRVVRQEGEEIWSRDGSGKVWRYRMRAVPASEVSGG